jgi:hypothetical protein
MQRGDKGSEVEKLQRALMELGVPLPRWGADGDLGAETLGALARLLQEHGKQFDDDADVVSEEELAFVYQLRDSLRNAPPRPGTPETFFDLRAEADRRHVIKQRTWAEVTGICLHQTACVLGERPQRWATVGAHLGVTREGKIIWLHDFDYAVVHGNGFNNQTVGIEMDGTYAGVEGDLKTFWRPKEAPDRQPQSPTPALIEAAKQTVRWICAEVERHGGKVKALVAHRQASKDRQSDPGSGLWQAVALPLHSELQLSDGGTGFKIGTGYPIPEAWDPSKVGIKY